MQVETMDAGLQAPEPMLDEMQQLAQRYARMVRLYPCNSGAPVGTAALHELHHSAKQIGPCTYHSLLAASQAALAVFCMKHNTICFLA